MSQSLPEEGPVPQGPQSMGMDPRRLAVPSHAVWPWANCLTAPEPWGLHVSNEAPTTRLHGWLSQMAENWRGAFPRTQWSFYKPQPWCLLMWRIQDAAKQRGNTSHLKASVGVGWEWVPVREQGSSPHTASLSLKEACLCSGLGPHPDSPRGRASNRRGDRSSWESPGPERPGQGPAKAPAALP